MIGTCSNQFLGKGQSPSFPPLLAIREEVMAYWEREVRARIDGANSLSEVALTRSLPALFDDIAIALALGCEPLKPLGEEDRDSAIAHGRDRARETAFGADQIAYECQIFKEALMACALGSSQLDSGQWAFVDQLINAAMRDALRSLADVHNEARRKVAAALSHDMRTPLVVIANGAQLISITPSMEMARIAGAKIGVNAARLTEMLGDLLDALTFQGGAKLALKLSRFDALSLAREVRDQYHQGGDWNIAFEANGDSVTGYWCRDALRRALENLINNAVKYGAGRLVDIKVHQNHDRLIVSVRNDGNPIPPEKQAGIFEYCRAEKGASPAASWGIGLPFVKAVVEAHGGDVSLDSSDERGTTFFICVPLDARPFAQPLGAQADRTT